MALAWYTTEGYPDTVKHLSDVFHYCLTCPASKQIKCTTLVVNTHKIIEESTNRKPCSRCDDQLFSKALPNCEQTENCDDVLASVSHDTPDCTHPALKPKNQLGT